MAHDRRTFLRTLGAAAAALATTGGPESLLASVVPTEKLGRIGIQLYTVRRQASADLAGVLEAIAKIGYKEVEFADSYRHTAAEARDMLRQNGLTAPSTHVTVEAIQSQPEKTFGDAHTLGVEWLTLRSLPRGNHVTVDDWKHVAVQFNDTATKAKAAGFRLAFHNHTDVIAKAGDVVPIDILMQETDPALVSYELDCYWAVSGGGDPVTLLGRYPGRFRMLHLKDGAPPFTDASQTDVGRGTIEFAPILAHAKGIEHYFVESDSAADPPAFARHSYDYLRR